MHEPSKTYCLPVLLFLILLKPHRKGERGAVRAGIFGFLGLSQNSESSQNAEHVQTRIGIL